MCVGGARGADARQPATETAPVRQLTHGVRPASGPKLRFKDIIKQNIKALETTKNTWEQAAMERSKYLAFLHNGAMLAEATTAERVKQSTAVARIVHHQKLATRR